MILHYDEIKQLQADGYLPEELHVGPSSCDLRLSNTFAVINDNFSVTLGEEVKYRYYTKEVFILYPHEFALASTQEIIKLPDNISAHVVGRSSIGRLGLQVQNASFIDAGFEGNITLELVNQTNVPIVLIEGYRVCQVVFHKMDDNTSNPYVGKYQHQSGATGSRIDKTNI